MIDCSDDFVDDSSSPLPLPQLPPPPSSSSRVKRKSSSSNRLGSSAPGVGQAKASKYRGVYRCGKSKWKAQIQIAGTQHYLGVFESQEKAAREYNLFAIRNGKHTATTMLLYVLDNTLRK